MERTLDNRGLATSGALQFETPREGEDNRAWISFHTLDRINKIHMIALSYFVNHVNRVNAQCVLLIHPGPRTSTAGSDSAIDRECSSQSRRAALPSRWCIDR